MEREFKFVRERVEESGVIVGGEFQSVHEAKVVLVESEGSGKK